MKAIGLELYSPDEDRSAVLTGALTPEGVDAGELRLALRKPARDRDRGRPRRHRPPAVPHRPHRLRHDRRRRASAWTRSPRSSAPPGADVPEGAARAAARAAYDAAVGRVSRRPRVLVRESIAESRRRAPALAVRRRRGHDLADRGDHRPLRRHRDPLGDQAHRRPDREGRPAQGDRSGRGRHRQRRRRRGDAPRHRRRERARVDRRLGRGADDRPARRARAQHPAGARGPQGKAAGSGRSGAASSSTARPSASSASAASASRSRAAASASGCA